MKISLVSSVVFLIVIASGCGSPSDEAEQQRAASVKAVTVEPTTLHPSVELVGSVVTLPERTAMLSSQIAGQISQVCVVEGQLVKKGDSIVLLDSRQAEAELGKADAAVAEARANVAMLEKGPLPAEIEAVRQEARNAAATADSQRAKLKALDALRSKGEIADVQYEMAKLAVTEAEAAGQAAAERLKTLQMGTRPEMVAQAKAKLQAAESDLALQKLNVELCAITSPIDGAVTQLSARLGASVEKQNLLATIADLSSLFARIRIPSKYLTQVRDGIHAKVVCDAAGANTFDGVIARLAQEADNSSGDLSAYIRIENLDGRLRPGLSCRAQLLLPEIPNAIAVPISAVADRNGVAVVTIIRDGKAHEVEVEPGIRTAEAVQIIKGIEAGEVVATDGGYGLPDGCPVTIEDGTQSTNKNV